MQKRSQCTTLVHFYITVTFYQIVKNIRKPHILTKLNIKRVLEPFLKIKLFLQCLRAKKELLPTTCEGFVTYTWLSAILVTSY